LTELRPVPIWNLRSIIYGVKTYTNRFSTPVEFVTGNGKVITVPPGETITLGPNLPAQLYSNPAEYGGGPGDFINDTNNHEGPYWMIKAVGGNVVINTGALPAGWTGNLNGLTLLNGDFIVITGMNNITLTSGNLIAYKIPPNPLIPT